MSKHLLYIIFLPLLLLAQKSKGTIYLTFDDGPINATKQLVETLNAQKVKATFFINGFHLYGEGDENEEKATESLKALISGGHIIANHTYDHMLHNCADGIRSGAEYCNEVGRWPVGAYGDPLEEIHTFYKNSTSIVAKAPQIANYKGNALRTLIRLPYTNSWRVTENLRGDALCSTTDSLVPWDKKYRCDPDNPSKSVQNATMMADMLEQAGCQIFGWDIDWGPTDWGVKYPAESMVSGEELLKLVDESMNQCLPPTMTPSNSRCHTFTCNAPERKGNVIVLAHDFLFEDGSRGKGATINLPKLRTFIKLAKRAGYRFDTLDKYISQEQPFPKGCSHPNAQQLR